MALRVEHVRVGIAVEEEDVAGEGGQQHGHNEQVSQRKAVHCRPGAAGWRVHGAYFSSFCCSCSCSCSCCSVLLFLLFCWFV